MKKFILLFVCSWAISLTYAHSLSQSNFQTETDTIYLEAETCTIFNPVAEPNKWWLDAWSGQYRFNLTWLSEIKTGVFDKEDLAEGRYNNYLWQYDESYSRILTKYTFEEVDLVVKYVPISVLIQQLNIDAKIKAVEKQGNVAYFTIHADREDLFARDTVQLEVANADVYEILGDGAFVMQGTTEDGVKVSVSLLTTTFPGEGYYFAYFNRPQTFVEFYENGDTIRHIAIKDDQGLAADADNATTVQNGKKFDLEAHFLAADTVLYQVKMHYELPVPTDTVVIDINNMVIDDSNAADGGDYYVDGYTDDYHVELVTPLMVGTYESPNMTASIQRLTNDNQANLMEMWGKVTYTTKNDSTKVYAEVIANDHVLYKINMCSSYSQSQSQLLLDVDVDDTCSTMGTVRGTGVFTFAEKCQIQAIPNSGYRFTKWDDGNTENPRMFFITKDTAFIAFFAPCQYTLTTSSNGVERGTTQGDTIADYLTEVQISATANYGYNFTMWSDGNTDNPRTISLTKDTAFIAQFDKNQYTITTSCNAEQGTIFGMQVAEYIDEVTLTVLPNVGYHFTQWTDGNTDNPRTFTITQDTTFTAEFAMDYSGKCGDDLYWTYSNKEVKITGTGAMYNYTDSTMPWTLLRDSIKIVRIGNTATSIGEYAFANTPKLAELYIGTNVEDIGANAFAGCRRLYDIYCYPIEPPFAENNSFANYNVYVYVPCENQRDYTLDVVWGEFKFIECIGSEVVVLPDDTVTVSPNFEDATFIWPVTDGADTYALVITKDDITFCTLVFNAQGQLVSIAFKPRRQNAPAEEGTTPATYAEMTANGFRFTVTGLDEGAAYAYSLTVRNAANSVLETYTGEFTTLSNTPTAISNSPDTTETVSDKGAEKLLRDGQVVIIRNGEMFDMMGQRL